MTTYDTHYTPCLLTHTGGGDIVNGNLKLILGLVWTLILHYQISMGFDTTDAGKKAGPSPKQALLEWLQVCINENVKVYWNLELVYILGVCYVSYFILTHYSPSNNIFWQFVCTQQLACWLSTHYCTSSKAQIPRSTMLELFEMD